MSSCCEDRNGRPKKCYATYEEAHRIAVLRERDTGARIDVYLCRRGNGYHLTRPDRGLYDLEGGFQ